MCIAPSLRQLLGLETQDGTHMRPAICLLSASSTHAGTFEPASFPATARSKMICSRCCLFNHQLSAGSSRCVSPLLWLKFITCKQDVPRNFLSVHQHRKVLTIFRMAQDSPLPLIVASSFDHLCLAKNHSALASRALKRLSSIYSCFISEIYITACMCYLV